MWARADSGDPQIGVVDEDSGFEVSDRRGRIEPQIVRENRPELLRSSEGLPLAGRAVEHEHRESPVMFSERVEHDQRLQLAHDDGVVADRDTGFGPFVGRDEP